MKHSFWFICLLFLFFGFANCGGEINGGSEVGNPSRPVQGYLVAESGEDTDVCLANEVIAKNSLNDEIVADVDDDCFFTLDLSAGKAYAINFNSDDSFVAKLAVKNSSVTLESDVFVLSENESALDLGDVTLSQKKAFPEHEPSTQNDQNGNGVNDYDDDDDDGDTVKDEREQDCDLDGFFDDHDEDVGSCDFAEDSLILEVSPRSGEFFVGADEEVEFRTSCDVEAASVYTSTFSVASSDDIIDCEFEISGANKKIKCVHEEQGFLPSTTYTATIAGIVCADGSSLSHTSWSWTTVSTDTD